MTDKPIVNTENVNISTDLNAPPVFIQDIFGTFPTSSTSAETTLRTGKPPRNMFEQIFVDTSTATKKIYIYDKTGNVWYSATIT